MLCQLPVVYRKCQSRYRIQKGKKFIDDMICMSYQNIDGSVVYHL